MAAHASNIVPHIPLDTSAEAHEVQRRIYAGLSGRERVAIAFRLSHTVRTVAMSGIRHRHPQYTEDQVRQAYARLCLGDALVRAVWPERDLVDP